MRSRFSDGVYKGWRGVVSGFSVRVGLMVRSDCGLYYGNQFIFYIKDSLQ